MKIILASILIMLVVSETIRLKRKHHKKMRAINIPKLGEVPCPKLYFLKYNEEDDLDHERLVNSTCTHCTMY